MKLFVTGATGFIGSHFVNHSHDIGHELVCLRRPESKPRIDLVKEPKWITGSMEDDMREILVECDVFVHLASHSTNVPYDTLEKCIYWNLTVSLKLFQQAKESGIEKYIVAGTGFEYGLSGERYEEIPIDAPLEPTMTYPASKAAASIAFTQWSIEHQLQLKYLRIFQVYGEGEAESRLWSSLRKAAEEGNDFDMTSGEQIRDFTPVEEIVKQFFEELDFTTCKKGVPFLVHVSAGNPQSMREFAEFWWKEWGATGRLHFGAKPYRKNEVMRFVPLLK